MSADRKDIASFASSRSGFSLISTLVGIAIISVGAVVLSQSFGAFLSLQKRAEVSRSILSFEEAIKQFIRVTAINYSKDTVEGKRWCHGDIPTFDRTISGESFSRGSVIRYNEDILMENFKSPRIKAAMQRCSNSFIPHDYSTSSGFVYDNNQYMHYCFTIEKDEDYLGTQSSFLNNASLFVEARVDFIHAGAPNNGKHGSCWNFDSYPNSSGIFISYGIHWSGGNSGKTVEKSFYGSTYASQ